MLRMLYDDFDQKVKNIHDEMDLHSYKKKRKKSVYVIFRSVLLSPASQHPYGHRR